jgi:BA14K-like protein
MLGRYKTLMLGALLGAGTVAFSGASVAGTLPIAPLVIDTNVSDAGIIQVNHRDWNRKRHGKRCREAFGDCRHFHGGFYYERPWWTLPVIIDDDYDDDDVGDSHVEWCLDRYRSYNPRTNTWVSYSGEVRECVSPYA